jgi:hypothetical protein
MTEPTGSLPPLSLDEVQAQAATLRTLPTLDRAVTAGRARDAARDAQQVYKAEFVAALRELVAREGSPAAAARAMTEAGFPMNSQTVYLALREKPRK